MNVIVIVCNSLHLGFLGPYGNGWIETHNIDRLAAEGVVFDHHFPENVSTIPTRRSWWTGCYGFPDPEKGWTPIQTEETFLADILFKQGVRSAIISDVPYLRDPANGFGRGFDTVVWVRGSGYDPLIPVGDPRLPEKKLRIKDEPGLRLPPQDDPDRALWKERWEQYLRNRAVLKSNEDEEQTGVARTVKEAIRWLDGNASEPATDPFFLWLDIFSPHGPWDPPLPYRDQYASEEPDEFEAGEEGDLVEEEVDDGAPFDLSEVATLIDTPAGSVGDVLDEAELLRLRRTYAGVVTMVDKWIGRLYDHLKSLGRLDDTLIVFTSDQGEPLGEHGFVRRLRPWLYEELIHTPLIVRMPKGAFGGGRHQALVQTVDLLPTVLSALDLPSPEAIHGQDLLPLIRGEKTKLRDYACLGMDVEEFAIRTHSWHLTVPLESDPDDPPRFPELYHKPEDRWDMNDVASQYPEVVEHLELALRRFVDAIGRDALDSVPSLRDVARYRRD